MIANHKRQLKPSTFFDKFFPVSGLELTDPILKSSGDVFDTILLMKDIVLKTLNDTEQLAPVLKGNSLQETCKKVFDFVYNHIQYTPDKAGVEQLRRPLRAWKDRVAGVDCDCYSIIISSILSNLKIPHSFRMTKYNNKSFFQHIYVVVPKKQGLSLNKRENYFVIDPVLDQFDKEEPYSAKHDKSMMPIQYLNGIDLQPEVNFGAEFNGLGELEGLGSIEDLGLPEEAVYMDFLARMKKHVENTRRMAAANPYTISSAYEPAAFIKTLDTLLANWDNAAIRDTMLAKLEEQEEKLSGLSGLGGFFSRVRKGIKKVASTVKRSVKRASKSVKRASSKVVSRVRNTGRAIRRTTKKVVKRAAPVVKKAVRKVANVAVKVGKAIVKYNPLSIAVRNGFLLAMKINMFRQAEKLGYGYWTESQARSKGLDITEFRKIKAALAKLEKAFKALQGNSDILKKNILIGWNKGTKKRGGVRGVEGLGAAATTGTAAASGFLATVAAWLKGIDFKKLFGKVKKAVDTVAPIIHKKDNTPAPSKPAPSHWEEEEEEAPYVSREQANRPGVPIIPSMIDAPTTAGMNPAAIVIGIGATVALVAVAMKK